MFNTAEIARQFQELCDADNALEAIKFDSLKPTGHIYKELHFLTDGTGTNDPRGWIRKALKEYNEMEASGMPLPDHPMTPALKCLYVKKFRKELQKLRKAHGGKLPSAEEIREYYKDNKDKFSVD